jgi:very-short-patch-repair endonuclease
MIHHATTTNRITRLATGVYVATSAVPTDPIDVHLQQALAQQQLRPTAIASHHTAALAWGLDLDDPIAAAEARPTFIRPASPRARSESAGPAIVHLRALPRHHRVEHPTGLLLTTPARAAVDVAAGLQAPEALITLDSAARLALHDLVGSSRLRDHYTDPRRLAAATQALHEAADVAATQFTRPALGRLVPLADPRRESGLESLSYGTMVLAGFPLPELQVRIVTPEGDAYPDFLWARQMVIGEADGMGKYATVEDLHREKRRQELLEQLGYLVIRWSWADMRDRPAAVLRRIEAALDGRGGW